MIHNNHLEIFSHRLGTFLGDISVVLNEKHVTTHRLLLIEPACSPEGISCSWKLFDQTNLQKENSGTNTLQDSGRTHSPSLPNLCTELESMWYQKEGNADLPLFVEIRHPRTQVCERLSRIPPEQMNILSGTILYKLQPRKIFLPK
jgi:hypothetical protein